MTNNGIIRTQCPLAGRLEKSSTPVTCRLGGVSECFDDTGATRQALCERNQQAKSTDCKMQGELFTTEELKTIVVTYVIESILRCADTPWPLRLPGRDHGVGGRSWPGAGTRYCHDPGKRRSHGTAILKIRQNFCIEYPNQTALRHFAERYSDHHRKETS